MTSLSSRVATALAAHNGAHPVHQHASGLYLGWKEWEELKVLAEGTAGFHISDVTPDEQHRVEFWGVKCYKVDAASHLAIA